MTTPRQFPKLCRCGCGRPTESARKHYTRECKAVVRANRYKSQSPLRLHRPASNATDPPRTPVRICRVCFDLLERRIGTCSGCGREWAPEGRTV